MCRSGFHDENYRLDDNYHITVDDGIVNVHYDFYDPMDGLGGLIPHFVVECIVSPGYIYTDQYHNWRR